MPHQSSWTQTYELRHSDLDFTGRLAAVGLARLLQETAGFHAHSLNLSPEHLRAKGLTWVLAKFHVKMHSREPGWRDQLHVETWRAGIERLFAARDYRARLADGRLVAEATSYWAVLDLATRRPIAIPTGIRESYPLESERVPIGAYGFGRMPQLSRTDCTLEHRVCLSDLDQNDHVTNSAYMDWALDSIPDELARTFTLQGRLPEIEITFKAEALLGEAIICRTERETAGDGSIFLHQIVRKSDSKELALARTRFGQNQA